MLTKDKFSNLESDLYLTHQILDRYFTSKESEPKEIKLNFQFSISNGDGSEISEDKAQKIIQTMISNM